jgi:hypothetical protein
MTYLTELSLAFKDGILSMPSPTKRHAQRVYIRTNWTHYLCQQHCITAKVSLRIGLYCSMVLALKYRLQFNLDINVGYGVGDVLFSKYSIPTDILTCEKPLLVEPIEEEAMSSKNAHKRERVGNKKKDLNPKEHKRNAFSTCAMTSVVNEAALFFKKHHCKPEEANEERLIML